MMLKVTMMMMAGEEVVGNTHEATYATVAGTNP